MLKVHREHPSILITQSMSFAAFLLQTLRYRSQSFSPAASAHPSSSPLSPITPNHPIAVDARMLTEATPFQSLPAITAHYCSTTCVQQSALSYVRQTGDWCHNVFTHHNVLINYRLASPSCANATLLAAVASTLVVS